MFWKSDQVSARFQSPTGVVTDPVTSVTVLLVEGPRNADGLLIPRTRVFSLLLALYKILLSLSSVALILGIILCLLWQPVLLLFENSTRQKPSPVVEQAIQIMRKTKVPFMLSVAEGVVENAIGWTAAITLRLRYLWVNVVLMGLSLGYVLVSNLLTDNSLDPVYPSLMLLLVCLLMYEIREANSNKVCAGNVPVARIGIFPRKKRITPDQSPEAITSSEN